MSNWKPTYIDTADGGKWCCPENVEIFTKIHDEHGERNEGKLTRKGNLWFTDPKDGIYVYYTPTHWKPVGVVGCPDHE